MKERIEIEHMVGGFIIREGGPCLNNEYIKITSNEIMETLKEWLEKVTKYDGQPCGH